MKNSKKPIKYILIIIVVTGILTIIDVVCKHMLGHTIEFTAYIGIFLSEIVLIIVIFCRYYFHMKDKEKK